MDHEYKATIQCYARAKCDDLPPMSHPAMQKREILTHMFKHMFLDSCDGHMITEKDHPEGYNMLILHPITKCIHWVHSADFDFIDIEE